MDGLEAKFRVSVQGGDELARFYADGKRGVTDFASVTKAALADTARSVKSFAVGLGRDLLSVSGLKLGLAANARDALEFRDSLEQLAVSAGIGDDKIAGLKKQILDTSDASNQFKADVVGALQAFVEKTGDIDTARRNLALYAQTATATRAAISDVAEVGVELSSKLNVKDQAQSFAILAQQAKAGAIELKDLASYGPRIFAASASAGMTGERGVREAGALAQMYATGFGGRGSAARVATAIEDTFGDIAKKTPQLEAAGIKVTGRDPVAVLEDIIQKTNGNQTMLRHIFGIQSMRGVNTMVRAYQKSGDFSAFDRFRDVTPAAGIIASDAARQSSTGLARVEGAQIGIERSSDEHLGDAADALAGHADLIAGSYNAVTAHPFLAAGVGAGGLFAANAVRRGLFGGAARGVGGGIASALTGGAGIPVSVTNWPASMGGSSVPGGGGGDGAKGGVLGAAGRWAAGLLAGPMGAAAIPAVALAGVGYELHRQQQQTAATVAAYNGAHPVDAEAARVFGTEYARSHNAVIRHGEMQMVNTGAPPISLSVQIAGDKAKVTDSTGTRSATAMVRRTGGE